jgi:type I restriction enzyme S subunit
MPGKWSLQKILNVLYQGNRITEMRTKKQNNKNVPNLRFKEFQEEWETKPLNELGNFIGGGTPSSANANFWNGEIPWVSSSDLDENDIHTIRITRFINEEAINNSATKLCIAPVILIVSRVGVGKVAYSTESLCTSQDFTNIVDLKCNGLLLSYLLSIVMRRAASSTQGTSIKGIPSSEIKSKKLLIPKRDEQQKIASFLSLIDERIAAQSKIIKDLIGLKSVLSKKIFIQELRFSEFSGGWEKKELGTIGEIVNGLTYSPDDIDENGVLVLRSSNIQNRELTFDDNVFVNVNGFNAVLENDILICVRNGSKNLIGKNAIIKKEYEGFAFGAFMAVYRSRYNKFLSHWFDTEEYKEEVHKNLGATINSINGSDLKKFKVPFPKEDEQQRIATFLSSIDQKIELETTILNILVKQKKYLLQQMFI